MKSILFLLLVSIASNSCVQRDKAYKSTIAQPNVEVLEERFIIKGLERERKIRVYLPSSYTHGNASYPVLYMHDGQNLFDSRTSYSGEWNVDETLNQLSDSLKLQLIVVGIDNGEEKRMNEMAPWDHEEFGKGEGKEYVDFIVKQVKPHIDSTYRTLPDRSNTGLMGSSMGGLISHYGVYLYPEVFGKVGIFSPSFWFSEEAFALAESKKLPSNTKVYMNVGEQEGRMMVPQAERMFKIMKESGHQGEDLFFEIVKKGDHSEWSWGREFEKAVKWMYL